MLQNARVTAFTVFDLLREDQLEGGGVKLPAPTTQIRVNNTFYERMINKKIQKS